MTIQNHFRATAALDAGEKIMKAARIGLVATAALATALPALACADASRLLQVEVNDNGSYVTRAIRNNSATVPHRPESDIDFPRR
jgi:hypothetical protein